MKPIFSYFKNIYNRLRVTFEIIKFRYFAYNLPSEERCKLIEETLLKYDQKEDTETTRKTELLLTKYPDESRKVDQDLKDRILARACHYGEKNIAILLLKADANLAGRDEEDAPLDAAIPTDGIDICNLLMKNRKEISRNLRQHNIIKADEEIQSYFFVNLIKRNLDTNMKIPEIKGYYVKASDKVKDSIINAHTRYLLIPPQQREAGKIYKEARIFLKSNKLLGADVISKILSHNITSGLTNGSVKDIVYKAHEDTKQYSMLERLGFKIYEKTPTKILEYAPRIVYEVIRPNPYKTIRSIIEGKEQRAHNREVATAELNRYL